MLMPTVQIGNRQVGSSQPVVVAAEIGINHNGDMNLAQQMVDSAVDAGADAVKFQSYRTADFVRDWKLTYTYRRSGRAITESQHAMFKRCELDFAQLAELKRRCDARGVIFHATPTSEAGVSELVRLGSAVLKNGSDYLTHDRLIRAMGETGLPTVLSTGMATLAEVEGCVDAFRSTGNANLVLLHCTSTYPTPAAEVNLRKMTTLARAFGCPVGFSDHTEGVFAAVGAVALGACWIEKHFTLDKTLPGPDQEFSADPHEFRMLVEAVRTAEAQLGCAVVRPARSESVGRRDFRLSCVAGRDIACGAALQPHDLIFARPGTGLPPRDMHLLLSRKLRRDVRVGELVLMEDME